MTTDRRVFHLKRLVGCMLIFGLIGFVMALTSHLQGAPAYAQAQDARIATARADVKKLGVQLKARLMTAMASGGPVAAVRACNVAAPEIAQQISTRATGQVGRTALRLRNPANNPDDWERAVLKKFLRDLKAGADRASLEHHEILDQNGQKVFRYMKAIITDAPCLACHGPNVSESTRQIIQDLYPEDQAVGFAPGSLRGAFTVVQPITE